MEYQPGVCNIGRTERRKRRAMAYLGFAGAIALLVAVVVVPLGDAVALLAMVPFFGAFMGFYQDRFAFCVGFAALARYDLSGSGGDAGSVTGEAVAKDRQRAFQIFTFSFVSALVATGVCYAVVGFL